MHPHLNVAIDTIRLGGKKLISIFNNLSNKNFISNDDFLLYLNSSVGLIMFNNINKIYPNHLIVDKFNHDSLLVKDKFIWIINILDGYYNFIHGIPRFSLSIAIMKNFLIENSVIYSPITEELFFSSKGECSQMNGNRIRISNNFSSDNYIIGFYSDTIVGNFKKIDFMKKIISNNMKVREFGSLNLDIAYTSLGRLDAFLAFDVSLLDICAGDLLMREAGGLITNFDYKFLNKNSDIFTGNPKLYNCILKL